MPDDDDVDECPMCEQGTVYEITYDEEEVKKPCPVCNSTGFITYLQAQRLRAAMRAEVWD